MTSALTGQTKITPFPHARLRLAGVPTVWAMLSLLVIGCSSPSSSSSAPSHPTEPEPVEPLKLDPQPEVVVDEDQSLVWPVPVSGGSSDLRLYLQGLPPGAWFDDKQRAVVFTPDFIQGGGTWTTLVRAVDGDTDIQQPVRFTVRDTITPPKPTIVSSTITGSLTKYTVHTTTDSYLDSPGYAGRSFTARVYVPRDLSEQKPAAVLVYLHGLGGAPYNGSLSGRLVYIYPHDPSNTYWWGYASNLPDGDPNQASAVPNYTQRRVLNLLDWVLHRFPGTEPERVYVAGGSMGGAGALSLGLLYGRHFAHVHATYAQAIAANHRPTRRAQLGKLWGNADADRPDGTALENHRGASAWTRQDMTRLLAQSPEARDQHIFTKHGKDDTTIHFGAVVQPSPLTGVSFYEALRQQRVGHYVVWDEGGHGIPDPVLGSSWWDSGWRPVVTGSSRLSLSSPFPAFSFASHDQDPGDGTGNGKKTWRDNAGYAGDVNVAGDTGWSGELAGARNRFLRWDSDGIVDTFEQFRMPLYVLDGKGSAPPKTGYPSKGDRLDATLPIIVNVTPRRVQRFLCAPGEVICWQFGDTSGEVTADDDHTVTVPGLALTTEKTSLVLTRTCSVPAAP